MNTSPDTCATCGHDCSDHVYYSGACRPGFLCQQECNEFVSMRPDLQFEPVELAAVRYDGEPEGRSFYGCDKCSAVVSDSRVHLAWHTQIGGAK